MLVMYKLDSFLFTKKENSFHVSHKHNKTKSTESQGLKINIFNIKSHLWIHRTVAGYKIPQ